MHSSYFLKYHYCACVASSPGSRAHCRRAYYIFSCDLIACGQDRSKDGCTSLPSAGSIVSALRALKSSYEKYRLAAFLYCLRTAAVLAHTKIHLLPPFYPTRARHAREKMYQTHSYAKVKHTQGPGNEASACAQTYDNGYAFPIHWKRCIYAEQIEQPN